MKLEEMLRKLEQIAEQARMTMGEYPGGLGVERQKLLLGLARQLQAHVRDQFRRGERQPEQARGSGRAGRELG